MLGEVTIAKIDTNMLGEVTIAFTFAKANVCVKATTPLEAAVHTSTNPNNAFTQAQINTAAANNNATYELTKLEMSMVRYNLPTSYSEALRSNLSSGTKYQIAFNHYQIHSQEANSDRGSIRWNENSRDIKDILVFFTSSTRDNGAVPLGFDGYIKTSEYFKYDNTIHASSQFQIGSVKLPQNALNSTDAFLELIRGIAGARGNNVEFLENIL